MASAAQSCREAAASEASWPVQLPAQPAQHAIVSPVTDSPCLPKTGAEELVSEGFLVYFAYGSGVVGCGKTSSRRNRQSVTWA